MTREHSAQSDQELFNQLRDGREKAHRAFRELYARHASRVFTYCRGMMVDEKRTEDVFQEAFINFYESAQVKRTMTNVLGFLLRIARNLCLNEKARKHHHGVPFEEFRFPAYHEPYESAELRRLVNTALETLPEEYREVIVLKEYLGFSYNEIADLLGTTMPVVRTRLYRAKRKLREVLAPYLEDLQG